MIIHVSLILYKKFYIIYTFYSSLQLCCRKNASNLHVSFYRFENQGLHTVHIHLLVWLENLAVINLDRVRASNPDDYSKLAYLVRTQYYSLHLNKKISPKMILILSSKFESDIFTILAFSSCRICNTIYSRHFT